MSKLKRYGLIVAATAVLMGGILGGKALAGDGKSHWYQVYGISYHPFDPDVAGDEARAKSACEASAKANNARCTGPRSGTALPAW